MRACRSAADHAADEMAAGGMAGQRHRTRNLVHGPRDRLRHIGRDVGEADLGAEPVGRHRHSKAVRVAAARQMGPEALVEPHPIAAMHEDDEPFRRSRRQEEVETLAVMRAIGNVELRPALPRELFAIRVSRRDP